MRKKQASLIASIVALIALMGEQKAMPEYERRKKRGGGRFRRTRREGGNGGKGRTGVKLLRKMNKRFTNPGWETLHPRPKHSGANRGHSTARLVSLT